jgi:hypothetical protein
MWGDRQCSEVVNYGGSTVSIFIALFVYIPDYLYVFFFILGGDQSHNRRNAGPSNNVLSSLKIKGELTSSF